MLIGVAIGPIFRRGYKFSVPGSPQSQSATDAAVFKARTAPAHTTSVHGNGFAGGPRQVSLQLKAWNSPVRSGALPSPKAGGAFNRLKASNSKPSRLPALVEPQPEQSVPVAEPFFESVGPVVPGLDRQHEESAPVAEPFFEPVRPVLPVLERQREESGAVGEPFFESVGPVLEQAPEVAPAVARHEIELDGSEPVTEFAEASTATSLSVENDILEVPEESVFAGQEANEFFEHSMEEAAAAYEQPNEVFASGPEYSWPVTEATAELTAAPIENDQAHETIFAEREAFVEQENFP